jgi:Leucine-rich repeat (LRR) protein
VLSLSKNRFQSLASFENFVNLQELNLNFNQLESLEGLVAPNLQKLYLSNNK